MLAKKESENTNTRVHQRMKGINPIARSYTIKKVQKGETSDHIMDFYQHLTIIERKKVPFDCLADNKLISIDYSLTGSTYRNSFIRSL